MAAAAAIGAGGGLLGAGLGWGQAVTENNKAWRRQKNAMQNQIRWRVADMRAAGINPLMAVSPGAGASAPSVSSAQIPDYASAMSSGARAGSDAFRSKFQKKQASAQTRAADTQATANSAAAAAATERANLDREKIVTEGFTRALAAAQTDQASANAESMRANAANTRAQLPILINQARSHTGELAKASQAIDFLDPKTTFGKILAGMAGYSQNPRFQSGGPMSFGQSAGEATREAIKEVFRGNSKGGRGSGDRARRRNRRKR